MDITVYECKTAVAVAVYLDGGSMVFEKGTARKDPPWAFGSGYQPDLHTRDCTIAKGRWEKMPRREAQDWVRRAQDYLKSLGTTPKKEAVG